uniref:Uncharacterized protein n=1 Tax=Cacopsylla melanoneura TaxID=428564 RepID=A0A8D9ESJ8_9HEMI
MSFGVGIPHRGSRVPSLSRSSLDLSSCWICSLLTLCAISCGSCMTNIFFTLVVCSRFISSVRPNVPRVSLKSSRSPRANSLSSSFRSRLTLSPFAPSSRSGNSLSFSNKSRRTLPRFGSKRSNSTSFV